MNRGSAIAVSKLIEGAEKEQVPGNNEVRGNRREVQVVVFSSGYIKLSAR